MRRIVIGLCGAAIFCFAATVAQAQTCPVDPVTGNAVAQMISPTNGSTLPAGAVTFEWCNASADYFLVVESVPGAHDIFNAFAGGAGPGAGVVSVTLGPACTNISNPGGVQSPAGCHTGVNDVQSRNNRWGVEVTSVREDRFIALGDNQ